MEHLQLSQANIRNLRSVNRFPQISREIYGIILETMIALRSASDKNTIATIRQKSEQAAYDAFMKGRIDLTYQTVYKISSIILDLCLTAIRNMPENKKQRT